MKNKRININIDEDILSRLDAFASMINLSRSAIIHIILKGEIEEYFYKSLSIITSNLKQSKEQNKRNGNVVLEQPTIVNNEEKNQPYMADNKQKKQSTNIPLEEPIVSEGKLKLF